MVRWLSATAVACLLLGSSPAWAATTPIDDFEGAGAPAPWVFGNGPEFPGANGSLTVVSGRGGRVAHLAYDFSCTGDAATCDPHYVQAELTPPGPLAGAALSMLVRTSNAAVKVRAVDATGQTLQYDVGSAVPLEAASLDAWHRIVVPLGSSGSYWGGANDGTLHPGIQRLAVLAEATSPRGAGFVDFDDVAIAGSVDELVGSYRLDLASLPLVAVPQAAAELAPRLGVNIHFTSDDQALDAAKSAGFSWIRMDLGWAGVERAAGTYDFAAFDTLVASAESRGMHTLLILDYGNPLYTGGGMLPPTTAGAIQAFGAYAEAAARHFTGRDVMFEVWNEPDLPGFWQPAADTVQYEAVLREAIARVHVGNPSAHVLTGGLSSPRPESYAMLETIFTDGAAAGADGVGMHLYVWAPPEVRYEDVLRLRQLIADRLGALPLYCTEWGFNSTRYSVPPDGHAQVGRDRQAIMDLREVLMSWRAGLPFVIVYDVRDDGDDATDPEHNFGLLARDYTDKPAMKAMRTLSSAARSRKLVGIADLADAPPGLHVLRLDGASDSVLVVWTEIAGASMKLELPTAAVANATTMYGDPIAMADASGWEMVVIDEAAGPVYVTLRAKIDDGGIVEGDVPAAIVDAGSGVVDAPFVADVRDADVAAIASAVEEPGGCGCRTSGGRSTSSAALALLLAIAARRRPRRGAGRWQRPAAETTIPPRCSFASSTS